MRKHNVTRYSLGERPEERQPKQCNFESSRGRARSLFVAVFSVFVPSVRPLVTRRFMQMASAAAPKAAASGEKQASTVKLEIYRYNETVGKVRLTRKR
jgi:hypothetical protein